MTKIKNFHNVKSIESAKKFNTILDKKYAIRDSKVRKNNSKIKDLENKISELKNTNYELDHPDTTEKIGFKYDFSSNEVDLDFSKIDKVAKLGNSTIYKINSDWFAVRGKSPTNDFNNVVWSLRKLTSDELYWKLDTYN